MFGSKNGVLWEMCKWRMNFCASANLTCGGGRGGGGGGGGAELCGREGGGGGGGGGADSFIWPKRVCIT